MLDFKIISHLFVRLQSRYLLLALVSIPCITFGLLRMWQGRAQGVERVMRLPQTPHGPDASLQAYLTVEGLPLSAEQLRRELAALPAEDGLLIASYPGEPRFKFRHYLFSHLGWPREIGALNCERLPAPDAVFYIESKMDQIRWILYFKRPPPAGVAASARELGHNLWLVPVKEGITWNLYCSQ